MEERVVLWVDDDEDDRLIAGKAVKRCRPDALMAGLSDGEELLQYLRGEGAYAAGKVGPAPVIVFLDLHMPRVSGLEVLAEIRNDPKLRGIPVVVVTSTGRDEEIEAAFRTGADMCVSRPASFYEFCESVKGALDRWMGVEEAIVPVEPGRSVNRA